MAREKKDQDEHEDGEESDIVARIEQRRKKNASRIESMTTAGRKREVREIEGVVVEKVEWIASIEKLTVVKMW